MNDGRSLRGRAVPAAAAFALVFSLLFQSLACYATSATWSGVDKTVVERFANEHGRQAQPPLIATDRGDLLLFLFLLAGAVGGFFAGYYWRVLMDQKKQAVGHEKGWTP